MSNIGTRKYKTNIDHIYHQIQARKRMRPGLGGWRKTREGGRRTGDGEMEESDCMFPEMENRDTREGWNSQRVR